MNRNPGAGLPFGYLKMFGKFALGGTKVGRSPKMDPSKSKLSPLRRSGGPNGTRTRAAALKASPMMILAG